MNDKEMGLYPKYNVTRRDGSSEPGGKHEGCQYFVLDLTRDKFAIAALREYAEACRFEYPQLSKDLKVLANEANQRIYGQPTGREG